MKYYLLLFLLLFSGMYIHAQELNLNTKVVATAGNNTKPLISPVNISKWRLGEVHLIQLQNQNPFSVSDVDWTVKPFPNPFQEELNLEFNTKQTGVYSLLLTDISGNEISRIEEKTVIRNETVKMKLAHLSSGMYLIHITQKNGKIQQSVKVQKH